MKKYKGFIFLSSLIFLFFMFGVSVKVFACDPLRDRNCCVSYYTCHYQSGTGLDCSSNWPDEPFKSCECDYSLIDGTYEKKVRNFCTFQGQCNGYMYNYNNNLSGYYCKQYGDVCGCSGKPKPIISPTPIPKPTPTPTPTVLGFKQCDQSCIQTSDCTNGLVCGYSSILGKRTCQNPSCFNAPGCRCSWQ